MAVLRQLRLLSGEIRTLIRYRACRLDEIITVCAADEAYGELDFLRQLSALGSSAEIAAKWNECVEAQRTLTTDAKKQLRALGAQLGRSDTEGQLDCLSMFDERVEQLIAQSETEYARKRGVFRALGLYGGIAAAIIIV